MTAYILLACLILAVAVFILARLYISKCKAFKKVGEMNEKLFGEIENRDNIILKLQEAARVQNTRTEKINTGTATERVAGSLDVLSDISKAGTARARKN
jgi:archaellum component FlaF (FlaF/FlaG flagellin family)